MNKFVLRQSLLLLLAASIWGFAFVAQSVSMDYVGPFTFNAARCLIGTIVLLPCIAVSQKINSRKKSRQEPSGGAEPAVTDRKILTAGGVSCGILLFAASNLQQFGIKYTTVGKAGFITAMYIVIVPVFGVFMGKKIRKSTGAAIVIAVAGLYLLCMSGDGFSFYVSDLLLLLCAAVFSLHILVIDHFSPRVDGIKMSCIQFFVCAVLSGICMFIFEDPDPAMLLQTWAPILYSGALSCGVGYTLQIIGQKGMNPTAASLILSLESVISVIAGWILLDQNLSGRELAGCALMFTAIILVQLKSSQK